MFLSADNAYFEEESDQVLIPTAWIPLIDATIKNGCMMVRVLEFVCFSVMQWCFYHMSCSCAAVNKYMNQGTVEREYVSNSSAVDLKTQ